MSNVTVLRCWPACVDAIDWSPDGIIALASDERVELLFPNTVDFDRDQVLPQWQHVPLKVPLFSTDELPLKELAPLSNYSIGEEISNSAPLSIAWSPQGLAKHRKCALGVLTTNLTLSIWSAEGKPQDESSWSRQLIINDALAEHFSGCDDEPSHLTVSPKEQLRLRSRIRAFAWAPALPLSETTGIIGTSLMYSRHFLAVSNDDNHLVFVAVESPTSTLGVGRYWTAEVLAHESLTSNPDSIFSEPRVFEDVMKQQRYISHIAWSPWILFDDGYRSVVVYATNEDVRARVIKHRPDDICTEKEVVYPGCELRYQGPMKWSPKIEDGNRLKLALFTNSGLVCLTISAYDGSIIETKTHSLDGRWDQISGAVWDTPDDSTCRLHLSSLLSTLHNQTSALEISPEGFESLGNPSWREKIENNIALFSVKNGLKGNSKAKVWGLSKSPLGDFIAACNSVHPSNMIEYGIPADRSGTVAVSSLRNSSEEREAFPKANVSAEGVSYTIRKLAEDMVEDQDDMPAFAEEIVQKLTRTYPAPRVAEDYADRVRLYADVDDLNSLIKAFKMMAFLKSHTLKDRYTILVSQACKTGTSHELERTLIAYRLANAVHSLPVSLVNSALSAEIVAQHEQLIKLVNVVMGYGSSESESCIESGASGTDESRTVSTEINGNASDSRQEAVAAWGEGCEFCSASIPFTDLTSASCTNGHQFARCGLSFLAIQAPGITKYCGICSTPFLSDEYVIAQESVEKKSKDAAEDGAMKEVGGSQNGKGQERLEQGNDVSGEQDRDGEEDGEDEEDEEMEEEEEEERELPVTLGRVLFLACDACVYCGGKFNG
ncbi:hypothetical protein COCSADRAFT_179737 [Bipolaris sorokiniana ND90Pr]|uniref:Transcription factor IIIC putative zinc-finger domain-containing protein n=1 Tax=Cochliobolus sativus (strain ND90Pr / ATCC 201652) TaxID=665912 RepID=M2TB87_COCSN|nr:uncharacterized protein COCSADRAFT_179737 [Bipolaris sorokiniana ND90Pr]EMD66476.1 hypothetical protein COCSADRAFT_179737 [Bipolaris sorokiniana ND90Pr]